MPNTTADYFTQARSDRDDLADNLVTMGVAASHSETFTALVPKVLDISGGGEADGSPAHPFIEDLELNLIFGVVSDTAPENPTDQMIWLDTSVTPNILRRYDADTETWIIIN